MTEHIPRRLLSLSHFTTDWDLEEHLLEQAAARGRARAADPEHWRLVEDPELPEFGPMWRRVE